MFICVKKNDLQMFYIKKCIYVLARFFAINFMFLLF